MGAPTSRFRRLVQPFACYNAEIGGCRASGFTRVDPDMLRSDPAQLEARCNASARTPTRSGIHRSERMNGANSRIIA